MKRFMALALLLGIIIAPASAFAAEQVGVYVAPKFVYGLTLMNSVKVHWTDADWGDSGSQRIGSKTDHAFGGSIAVGYDFEKRFGVPVRAELEYAGFTKVEAEKRFSDDEQSEKLKQTFGLQTLFVNAYWDIDTGTKFTPYIGAGLGMAFINTKIKNKGYDFDFPEDNWNDSTSSKNVTNFAWNLGAGLGYDFTDSWTLDVGYRFVGLGSAKTKTYRDDWGSYHGKANDLYQHQFAVGVRYTF